MKKEIKNIKELMVLFSFGVLNSIAGIVSRIFNNTSNMFLQVGGFVLFSLFGILCALCLYNLYKEVKKIKREHLLNDFDFLNDVK